MFGERLATHRILPETPRHSLNLYKTACYVIPSDSVEGPTSIQKNWTILLNPIFCLVFLCPLSVRPLPIRHSIGLATPERSITNEVLAFPECGRKHIPRRFYVLR